jgi:hypothetical protein
MKNRAVILAFVIIFSATGVNAQKNPGFEYGLAGWQISGKKSGASLDSIDAYQGKYCAKISSNTGIFQQISVSPFSILQFNIFLKCSDAKTVAFSFIRFYDSKGRELLEYKSGPISTVKYLETGNYTEAPPFTKYARIGIERDSTNGYVYADSLSLELNIGEPLVKNKPICNLNEYMKPFWKGDTIYNETVLLYSENGREGSGRLLYEPTSILSVKSFDLKTEYKRGLDYIIKHDSITRNAGSNMPFRTDSSFDRKNDLAWFNLQSAWVLVTYTHKEKWDQFIPSYKGYLLPKTIAKLKSKSAIKIIAFGMSITRGLDVSSYDMVSPFMPGYNDLFVRELRKIYRYKDILMYNAGLPGALVSWGADYADKYLNPLKPDLVIIDFGMNDFWRYKPEEFKGYIETIISKVKKGNPNTEFLLLSNMDFDPDYILDSDKNKTYYVSNMQGYKKVLNEMEKKGIINLDMTSLSDLIYQRKKAKDCIANPLHPNDYLARWYAQAMSALFREQEKK